MNIKKSILKIAKEVSRIDLWVIMIINKRDKLEMKSVFKILILMYLIKKYNVLRFINKRNIPATILPDNKVYK